MTPIDPRLLEIFRVVAEVGSATSAAVMLHTTQPSVTRAVAELERRCGFVLFERVRLGMRLTAEGKMLLGAVRRNYEGLTSVGNTVDAIRQGDAGIITACCLPMLPEVMLMEIVGGFLARHPKVQFKVEAAAVHVMFDLLATGHIDFGVVTGPLPNGQDYELLPAGRSRLMLVVNRKHRLAKRKTVRFSDVDGETIVELPAPHNLRAAVDMMILSSGIRPKLMHEAGTQRASAKLVEYSDCVTFVDSLIAPELDRRKVVAIPVEPPIQWDVNLVYRRDRRHAKTFLNFLVFAKRFGAALRPAGRSRKGL
jgi:DNA-binding transcriptional LysR family regulator